MITEGDLVSAHHALIRWTGEAWELRDLGSRNGTWLANSRLGPGEGRVLGPGLTLAFGDPKTRWRVDDLAPPVAMAIGGRGQIERAEDGMLLLPEASAPELYVAQDINGQWIAEATDGAREPVSVADGDSLELRGGPWQLWLPITVGSTATAEDRPSPRLDALELCLHVSADEEHVELRLIGGSEEVLLPHRAHTYLLLTLARARLTDAQERPEADPSEHGWVYQDRLARRLRIPEEQFNVTIYRARRQLAEARIIGAEGLVERRRGSGQIRLGTSRVQILPL